MFRSEEQSLQLNQSRDARRINAARHDFVSCDSAVNMCMLLSSSVAGGIADERRGTALASSRDAHNLRGWIRSFPKIEWSVALCRLHRRQRRANQFDCLVDRRRSRDSGCAYCARCEAEQRHQCSGSAPLGSLSSLIHLQKIRRRYRACGLLHDGLGLVMLDPKSSLAPTRDGLR